MYPTRHTGPPNNPQPPQPAPSQFSAGPMTVINESCDKIRKEFDALQAANHSLRMELEKLHNDKAELHRHFIMYYDMSYALHLDICKQKEIAKRLNTIIIKILPLLTSDHHAQIASSVDQANQVSPEDLNRILDQQLREGYASADLHGTAAMGAGGAGAGGGGPGGGAGGSAAGLPGGLPRPLPGMPGMPGSVHGLPPHCPPLHLPHSMPPHGLGPPHGPPLHGLPPQALLQPALNISSPPNAAGLLAMSGGPGLPGMGPGGMMPGMPGGPLPPHLLPKDPNHPPSQPSSRNNQMPLDNNNPLSNQAQNTNNNNNQNSNNTNNNNSNSTFNHNKPPRNSIDAERRTASGSSVNSDRDHHNNSQLNDIKPVVNKKSKRNDDSSSASMVHNQHQVMLHNSSSVSDDEKSEDLVVDGNDDRVGSPNSHHNGGSTSPRENGGGSVDWSHKTIKKERPLSRASSVASGCGPSGRERASPKTGSHKTKSSPTTAPLPVDPLAPLGPGLPNQMLPGLGGYGRGIFPVGPIGPDGLPVLPGGPGAVRAPFNPSQEPYSIQLDPEGVARLIPCSPRALADSSVPKRAREVFSLDHGEVVCAVALSNPTRNIYTGGKGLVKVWSIDNSDSNNEMRAFKTIHNPVAELACLPPESYVRSCKLLPDGKKLIVGGEVPPISVWDLANGGAMKIGELKELATACYALAISPDSKTCITCFSDGNIGLYDVHNLQLIGKFQGHGDGASCIDISSDGNTLWTGGLDTTLKSWNLKVDNINSERDFVTQTNFGAQIFSLGCCPTGNYIAVGMENSIIEVLSTSNRSEKIQLKIHDSCVLAIKFAASGKWFISTGKDKLLNLCGSPAINCPLIMKFTENSSVLSCDISSDDKYFATGSGEKKATVYEVLY